jgi:hypothetical protein
VGNPLIKLPIGSIRPGGWLRVWLELERDGMVGHLNELSPWLNPDNNAWRDIEGKGSKGWEELPYWLKGYGDLGYVLDDKEIIRKSKEWLDAVLKYQQPDGYFGPIQLKDKHDHWPHMVMLNCLQTYHEFTKDKRVITFMLKF